jgi:hypothetical protein
MQGTLQRRPQSALQIGSPVQLDAFRRFAGGGGGQQDVVIRHQRAKGGTAGGEGRAGFDDR